MDEKNNDNNSQNPATGSVTGPMAGAVIGAGIGVAGTLILKNASNRKKIKGALGSFRDQMLKRAELKKKEIAANMEKGKEKINKVGDIAKDSLSDGILESKDVIYGS